MNSLFYSFTPPPPPHTQTYTIIIQSGGNGASVCHASQKGPIVNVIRFLFDLNSCVRFKESSSEESSSGRSPPDKGRPELTDKLNPRRFSTPPSPDSACICPPLTCCRSGLPRSKLQKDRRAENSPTNYRSGLLYSVGFLHKVPDRFDGTR